MSRRRRRDAPDDSLELLLDPICNMFGTIMFVALIAALLALSRSSEVVAEAVSAAERHWLRIRNAVAARRLAERHADGRARDRLGCALRL